VAGYGISVAAEHGDGDQQETVVDLKSEVRLLYTVLRALLDMCQGSGCPPCGVPRRPRH
jgi:hypothetical protein